MGYIINRVLNTLTIATQDGKESHQLSILSLVVSSFAKVPYPNDGTNVIVLAQGTTKLYLPITDITQVGGVAANNTLTGLTNQVLTLCSGIISVAPSLTISGHVSKATSATGATFVAFDDQPCLQFTIANDSAVNIDVQQAGASFPVMAGSCYTFFGLTNANQLSIRRSDTNNTSITIRARWEK